jgi:hypothetical protein
MKRLLSTGLALAMTLALAAAASADKPTQFKLMAQNGSGENGTATILQGSPGTDEVIVMVRMSGAPADVAQPMHIHKGTCAKLDPKPTYPLTALMDGRSESKVKGITLADLEKGDYAINVHKSAREVPVYVACGNLKVMGMGAMGH